MIPEGISPTRKEDVIQAVKSMSTSRIARALLRALIRQTRSLSDGGRLVIREPVDLAAFQHRPYSYRSHAGKDPQPLRPPPPLRPHSPTPILK